MKNIILNAEIAPYRTFEEELEIYQNDVDYIWKISADLVYNKEEDCYLGGVIFNQSHYPARLLKSDKGYCVIFADSKEVYNFIVGNNSNQDNIVLYETTKDANTELGFGECYIKEKDVNQDYYTNVSNRYNNLINKDSKLTKIVNNLDFSQKNNSLLNKLQKEINVLNDRKFCVYKGENGKSVNKIGLYSAIKVAHGEMVNYIYDQMLAEKGENLVVDKAYIEHLNLSVQNAIDSQQIELEPAQREFLQNACADFIYGSIKNHENIGLIVSNVCSGSRDFRDVCIEKPADQYITELAILAPTDNFDWIIKAFKNMTDKKTTKEKYTTLIEAMVNNKIDINKQREYEEMFGGYYTLQHNLRLSNQQLYEHLMKVYDRYQELIKNEKKI